MACTMSPYLPPHGRVSRAGGTIASESVVGYGRGAGAWRDRPGGGRSDLRDLTFICDVNPRRSTPAAPSLGYEVLRLSYA